MKSLFALLILSTTAWARLDYDLISQVRSFQEEDDHVVITLEDDPRVFRPSNSHSALPCLRNAWLSRMPVALILDEGSGIILECRLHPKRHPGNR